MEIFDVVNERDQVIGQATREECHSNPELIHRTAQFTLIDKKEKRILLTQRSFTKSTDPGKWCFLGEHLLSGETYAEAVARGIEEELGFKLQGSFTELGNHLFHQHHQTELVRFFVASWHGQEIRYDKNELMDYRWVSTTSLKKDPVNYSEAAKLWIESIRWEEAL